MSVICVVVCARDRKRTRVKGRVQDGAIDCKLECFGDSWVIQAYTLSFWRESATVEHVRRENGEQAYLEHVKKLLASSD
jgi:hypothetical protein